MQIRFILYFLLLFPLTAEAQQKWNILFGTEEFTGLTRKNLPEDLPRRIVQNSNGEFYVSGTNSNRDGEPKEGSMGSWVTKFSADGKLLWHRVADINLSRYNPDLLCVTSDGGIATAVSESGTAIDNSDGGMMLHILKPSGEAISKYHLSNSLYTDKDKGVRDASPIFVFKNPNEGLSIIASIQVRKPQIHNGIEYMGLVNQIWLMEFTEELQFIRARALDIPDITVSPFEFGVYAKFDNRYSTDGSFCILRREREDRSVFSLHAFDKNGSKLWKADKKYDVEVLYYGIAQTPSGKTLLYASVDINNPAKAHNSYIIYDQNGKQEYEFKTKYEGIINEVVCVDNEFVVAFQYGIGEGKMGLKKINPEGKEFWKKPFGLKSTMGLNLIPTIDKGFALLAYTKEFGANYIDALIVKTDENGNTDLVPKKYIKANP
jgi:hypothetical protein